MQFMTKQLIMTILFLLTAANFHYSGFKSLRSKMNSKDAVFKLSKPKLKPNNSVNLKNQFSIFIMVNENPLPRLSVLQNNALLSQITIKTCEKQVEFGGHKNDN